MDIEKILIEIKEYFRESPKPLNNVYPLDYEQFEKIKEYKKQLERENKKLKHTNKTYKGIINKQNTDKKKIVKELEIAIDFAKTGNDLISKVQASCLENVLKMLKGENDEC